MPQKTFKHKFPTPSRIPLAPFSFIMKTATRPTDRSQLLSLLVSWMPNPPSDPVYSTWSTNRSKDQIPVLQPFLAAGFCKNAFKQVLLTSLLADTTKHYINSYRFPITPSCSPGWSLPRHLTFHHTKAAPNFWSLLTPCCPLAPAAAHKLLCNLGPISESDSCLLITTAAKPDRWGNVSVPRASLHLCVINPYAQEEPN